MKRLLDFSVAAVALLALSPLLIAISIILIVQDGHSPFYPGLRVGRSGHPFRMLKFRSMRKDADRTGVMSTSGDDARITPAGRFVRRYKLDELPQLFNIVRGDMSFVGPRPNVPTEVALYSHEEEGLLKVRPGVTDFASIVFADEGEILEGSHDPNRDYNLLIRPWKSRLGLHYIRTRSLRLDVALIRLTALAILSRPRALAGVERWLARTGAEPDLVRIARRNTPLEPTRPPGVTESNWEGHLTYESS